MVAETLTRGRLNIRVERTGRPEVKNLLLAPKQFDPVNRDLEIRDIYNMEDGFHLADGYLGAYRTRLNANLAFWDGLDGTVDWPTDDRGDHPLTKLVLADHLVVDIGKPYREHGSFLEIERAALARQEHQTCGGRALNDDAMDTFFTPAGQRWQRAGDPGRRRPVLATGVMRLPIPLERESHLPSATRTRVGGMTDALDLDDCQAGALHERPSPYVGTYVLLRVNNRQDDRDLIRRLIPLLLPARSVLDRTPSAWMTVAFTYQGLKALGVPQESLDSFVSEFRQGMAARAAELGDVGESGPDHWEEPLGRPGRAYRARHARP